jgi:hypothetical protein
MCYCSRVLSLNLFFSFIAWRHLYPRSNWSGLNALDVPSNLV